MNNTSSERELNPAEVQQLIGRTIKELLRNLEGGDYEVRPGNVYHDANRKNIELMRPMLDAMMFPQSFINGMGNLVEFYRRSQRRESCLMLVEHYSNLDFPELYRLCEKAPELGPEAAATIMPIQGMKLTEGNPATPAFSNSFSSISIYPSRSIDSVATPEERNEIRKISTPINHSAMSELTRKKYQKKMVLVFPAGTRYRAWNPESGRGVREIDSYLKVFQNVVFISINGNSLMPHKDDRMDKDYFSRDLLIYTVSPIVNGRAFRREILDAHREVQSSADVKQVIADEVMTRLREQHDQVEPLYRKMVAEIRGERERDRPVPLIP